MNTIQRIEQLEKKSNTDIMDIIRLLQARILVLEDIHEDEGYSTRRPKRQSHVRTTK
jgi:hypothetical protein